MYQIAPSRSLKVLEGHYGASGRPAARRPRPAGPQLGLLLGLPVVFRDRRGHPAVVLGAYPAAVHPGRRRQPQGARRLGRCVDRPDRRAVCRAPAAGRRPGRHRRVRPRRGRASARHSMTSTRTAGSRAPARTCCTRPRPRCWPRWTANGTGWPAHRDFPDLPLDNNTAERAIRTPVVGRKNYNGSGAAWAAGPGRPRLDDPGHRQDRRAQPPRLPSAPTWTPAPRTAASRPAARRWRPLLPWNITLPGAGPAPDPAGATDIPP